MKGKVIQILLFAILLLIPTVIHRNPMPAIALGIEEYAHRKEVLINYATGAETLTDYQVLIKLDANNFHFNETMENGEDIRFTDEDGITPLDYWVERWNSTQQSAFIWVKVPSIARSQEKTIYFYYGKLGDTSASSGEATFPFFDDFTNGLDKWLTNPGVSIDGNMLKLQGNTSARSSLTFPIGEYAIFAKTWGEGTILLCYVDANTGYGFGMSVVTGSLFWGYMISPSGIQCIGGAAGPSGINETYILQNGRESANNRNVGIAMLSNYYAVAGVSSWSVSINDFIIQLRSINGLYLVNYIAARKYNGWGEDPSVMVGGRVDYIVVPDDYLSINEAIRHLYEGGTIFVKPGTYHENVVVSKPLSLVGAGSSTTVIDGYGAWSRPILVNANNVTVTGFTLRDSEPEETYAGIYIGSVSFCNVYDNVMTNNCEGILLYGSSYASIHDNILTGNGWNGIRICGSSHNTVASNNISGSVNGIYIQGASLDNQVLRNHVSNVNEEIGLQIITDSNCSNTFIENTIIGGHTGIYIAGGSMHVLYHNNIINCAYHVTCYSSPNIWDNGYPSGGNYWSNYEGTDLYSGPFQNETGSDGIGDTPYGIATDNIDHYPLMQPDPTNSTQPNPSLGDFNGDSKVGPGDFALLAVAYGSTPQSPKWNPNCDVNGDGKIGPYDFAILSAHYGQYYP